MNDPMLGQLGRDKITGFEGIITGKAEYLYGCTQYVLVPKAVDATLKQGEWFDSGRVEIVGSGISAEEVRGDKDGGPNSLAPTIR